MSRVRFLIAVATVATGGALLIPTVASAHSNAVQCVDQSTSTWRITNDHPLAETFTSTEGPSGSVAAGNGSFTDVVWNGDTLHVTGTWTDGFVGSTTGSGDCSPDVQPTTTTTLVTTTTAQETTTLPSTTTTVLGEPTTTVPASSTSTSEPSTSSSTPSTTGTTTTVTTAPPSTSTIPPSSSPSVPSTTLPPPSSAPTTPPPTSTPSGPPTSTPTPCLSVATTTVPSGQPGAPSAPPCGRLPATGNPDLGILTGIAAASIIAGAFMLTKTRR